MARVFSVGGSNLTLAGATTLVFVNPAAAPKPNIEFLRFWASQAANATSAQQRIQVETQVTAFPTLTSATPRALTPGDTNASFITGNTTGAAGTCGVNASAEGAGSKTSIWDDAFNVLNGYLWVATPRETLVMPAGYASGAGLYFPVAPATLTTWQVGANFAEV